MVHVIIDEKIRFYEEDSAFSGVKKTAENVSFRG